MLRILLKKVGKKQSCSASMTAGELANFIFGNEHLKCKGASITYLGEKMLLLHVCDILNVIPWASSDISLPYFSFPPPSPISSDHLPLLQISPCIEYLQVVDYHIILLVSLDFPSPPYHLIIDSCFSS